MPVFSGKNVQLNSVYWFSPIWLYVICNAARICSSEMG